MELAKLLKRSGTGAERGSRCSQGTIRILYDRVRATKHAPRCPCRLHERRHSFAEIAERGAVVLIDRLRESLLKRERAVITITENALRNKHPLAVQRPGFF